jgi:hypothetical protein
MINAPAGYSVTGSLSPRDGNLVGVTVTNVASSVRSACFFDSPKRAFLVEIDFEESKKLLFDEDIKGASYVIIVDVLRVGNTAAAIIDQTGQWRQVDRLRE